MALDPALIRILADMVEEALAEASPGEPDGVESTPDVLQEAQSHP